MTTQQNNINERIYQKLQEIIPDLESHIARGVNSGISELHAEGVKGFYFDYVHTDDDGNPVISLAHRHEYSGQMVPDPEVEICLMPELKQARALSFHNIHVYEWVRDGDVRAQEELDGFLNGWLSKCIQLGHKIDLSREAPEIETLAHRQSYDRTEHLTSSRTRGKSTPQRSL